MSALRNYRTSLRTRIKFLFRRATFRSDAKNIEAFYEKSYAKGHALVFKEKLLDLLRSFRKPSVKKK